MANCKVKCPTTRQASGLSYESHISQWFFSRFCSWRLLFKTEKQFPGKCKMIHNLLVKKKKKILKIEKT